MKKIAVLDKDIYVLAGIEHTINHLIHKHCVFLTHDINHFIDNLYNGTKFDSAIIGYNFNHPELLTAISSYITLKGPKSLIVLLKRKNKNLLRLMHSMNVSWVIFLGEDINTIAYRIKQILLSDVTPVHNANALTTKETEVIAALLDGLSTETVAKKMHLSIKTISTHKRNALKKIGISSLNALCKKQQNQQTQIN